MHFSRNVQLAVTWQIISEIMLFHGSELEIEIEQNNGDSGRYSLALTENRLGYPYLRFNIAAQTVEVECPPTDHATDIMDAFRPVSELGWDTRNYVKAFLTRNPSSVILDIEAMAGFARNKYSPCGTTPNTLPVALIAGLLHQRIFAGDALEVTNAFRHSSDEEKSGVRLWAQSVDCIPEWAFDEQDDDWVEKAKVSLHLWKLEPAENLNQRESNQYPGIVFDIENSRVTIQGDYKETVSLWDLYMAHEPGNGYKNLLELLGNRLDYVLQHREESVKSNKTQLDGRIVEIDPDR